jgi:hypothetical protein
MPDWAPKAPIQFSNYACFNHRAPDLSSDRARTTRPSTSPALDDIQMRNLVDAARLLRERLVSNGS